MPLEIAAAVKLGKAVEVFSKMFSNNDFKDCELHTNDGKVVKCHKSILAAKCFEASSMEQAIKGVVKIKKIDSNTMNQQLRFAYCLEVEDLDDIAYDLIYAAEKYQMKELKEVCVDSIIATWDEVNVLDSLIIAEKISDCKNLFDECFKTIAM